MNHRESAIQELNFVDGLPVGSHVLTGQLRAMAKEYPDQAIVPPHSHPQAQLLYAVRGVMRVTTDDTAWVVPPARAVWIPAGRRHALQMVGPVSMRTLFARSAGRFRPDTGTGTGTGTGTDADCRVIVVSGLLRELILRAVMLAAAGNGNPGAGRHVALLAGLIRAELLEAAVEPVRLPLPRDARLRRLCAALLAEPAANATLDQWAAEVGASSRTLARLFQSQTGLSFGVWRQQARLTEAVCRLAAGQPVQKVAPELGYLSASAFTAMFRRAMGVAPQRYIGSGRSDA